MKTYTNLDAIVKDWKSKLTTDRAWIEKGIIRIFEYQTASEQHNETVNNHNNVGFTPADAKMLSSFAKQLKYKNNYHLSPKQLAYAAQRMPKYARQLLKQSIAKGLVKQSNGVYFYATKSKPVANKKVEREWTEEDNRRWIEYKNEYARLEAEQEQRAFEAKMEREMSRNRK